MKIYKVSYYDEDEGNVLAWFTSRKEAEKYLSRERGEGREGFEITTCQFPATRQGIVDWLSSSDFASTDNG